MIIENTTNQTIELEVTLPSGEKRRGTFPPGSGLYDEPENGYNHNLLEALKAEIARIKAEAES